MTMTRSKLKKIIEQELIKEFGLSGGRVQGLGSLRDKEEEEDVPDYTQLKRYEEDKKKDCFDEEDFESKSHCIQNTQNKPEKSADAIVAKVLRDKGEIK
jgi:hypothetical protein